MFVYMYVYANMSVCVWCLKRPEGGIRFPTTGILMIVSHPVGAGYQAKVLRKSSSGYEPLSPLSNSLRSPSTEYAMCARKDGRTDRRLEEEIERKERLRISVGPCYYILKLSFQHCPV